MPTWATIAATTAALAALASGGCVQTQAPANNLLALNASTEDRDCMARAMYFESKRSSTDGMLAVGTIVANRLQSGKYPKTICGVVGQERQFAKGVLSKPAEGRAFALAQEVADAVIDGERHDVVGAATHFHTAGLSFPYPNMAYVAKAGGNVFYEKKPPGTFEPVRPHMLVARDEAPGSRDRELADPEAKQTPATRITEATLRIPLPPRRDIAIASADEE
ncbi:cell wall hydrolase [uncultured Enterovirga sp.]|uniref:cell wall hydrolase n=1 Tax=uncultured Enterovirga sp. TaxID=2026352 RepID=UPI0035CAF85F